MKPSRSLLPAALALVLGAANAHDTWFEALPVTGGATVLALGTGTRFPAHETGIEARFLVQRACRAASRSGAGPVPAPSALPAQHNEDHALWLQAPAGAATCWAQLTPFDIELAPDKVPVYLQEIQATPEVRAAWAAMQARGLPWRERYAKHARIELAAPSSDPAPTDLDLHLETAGQPVRVGSPITAQALLKGRPLAGLALELRSENSPLGLWRRTDAQGRIAVAVPLPGRWLLRGVDLRVSGTDPDRWDSRFATLAFDARPAAGAGDQKGSSLTLNARSTSQAAATTAISKEPPSSTARR